MSYAVDRSGVSGRLVILVLGLAVVVTVAGLVFWARSQPTVPQARKRMEGLELPSLRPTSVDPILQE